MRIVAMSDSHGRHARFRMPEGDAFVHAGDFSNFGSGVEEFALWYWNLPYRHKVVVLGNHEGADATAKRSNDVWRKLFGPTLLDSQACEIGNGGDSPLRIYGAPFGAKAFTGMPAALSVLLTHEPPFRILDRRIGSEEVAEIVEAQAPLVHIFGHVHQLGGRSIQRGRTLFVNAATKLVTIDVEASGARAVSL